MGKAEVWDTRWAGWLASTLGAFPVARGSADREALKRCIATLEGGEPLVLFPEGERKDGPVIQPLFDGAAFVAAKAGVPIIPIGIGGSARVMPRHAKMIHPAKVCRGDRYTDLRRGRPNRDGASRAAITSVTTQLSAELQRLFDRAEGEVARQAMSERSTCRPVRSSLAGQLVRAMSERSRLSVRSLIARRGGRSERLAARRSVRSPASPR